MSEVLTGKEVSVRTATPSDRDAVENLLIYNKLPVAGLSPSLEGFLVAEQGDEIVGTIGLERYAEYGLLRSAAVSSSSQGRGIGRLLVQRLVEDAVSDGVKAIYLLTTTAEDYFPAFGFVRVDRAEVPYEVKQSVEFADACPASAAVLYKVLS